ncbi:O-antigen ligase family protein [Methylocystis echinoides]|uniref:O-antigen ligase family protein n=1 Tax=Methylocystis echinoides TaxID=29468 RepID=UPI00342A496F
MTNASGTRLAPASSVSRAPGLHTDYQKIVNATFVVFIASGAVVIVEPSPYDLLFFITLPIWFVGGFSVHRTFFVPASILFGYTVAGFLALIPYWDNADSSVFQYVSAFLSFTALFFAVFFANETERRTELCLKAYMVGAFIASLCAIAGYFDIGGLGELFTRNARATGPFKDPNVYGSFAFVGAVYLAQNLTLGRTRHPIASAIALVSIVSGVFLSFSRGSWGATVVAMTLMAVFGFFTMDNRRMKRRVAMGALVAVIVIAVALAVLLSLEETRAFFLQRASVTQDYDEGATGRFGNQARSLPMLVERFWGFGPRQFEMVFGLVPHNTYIGSFANNGWIGGFLFILLAAITCFVGFRLMMRASPFRRHAQVVFPSLFAFFLQGFQIDIDHWRHFYLLLGAVWGLEAARQRGVERQSRPVEAHVQGEPRLRDF